MKKATQGWPLWRARARRRSMHLLDAREQPAARAVGRLDQVPYLGEVCRGGARRLACLAREPHAYPVAVAFGRHVGDLGLEVLDVGLLALCAARQDVPRELTEHLVGGEFPDVVEAAAVVGELQADEIHLGAAKERRRVEPVRQ